MMSYPEGWSTRHEDSSLPTAEFFDAGPSGYRPRSILSALSDSSESVVFIGARDGSLTRVALTTGQSDCEICPCHPAEERAGSIEALCSYDRDRQLLAGDRLGHLWLLEADNNGGFAARRVFEASIDHGPVTFVDRLDPLGVLLVSWQRHASVLFPLPAQSNDLAPWQGLETFEPSRGIVQLVFLGRWEWLAVSQSGEFFHLVQSEEGQWQMSVVQDPWQSLEKPGLVLSVALVGSDQTKTGSVAAYLATDAGIFLFSRKPRSEKLDIRRIYLPGARDVCTALACPSLGDDSGYRYLWAADSTPAIHLFRSDRSASPDRQIWRRIHSRWISAQVTKAAIEKNGTGFRVIQACRDDRVICTDYRRSAADTVAENGRESTWQWLADQRREGLDGATEYIDGKENWHCEAEIADHIERVAQEDVNKLLDLLADPDPGPAGSALLDAALGRGGTWDAATPADRVRVAIYQWTHALLGVISRRIEETRQEQAYLAVIRWLRRLGENVDLPDDECREALRRVVEVKIHFVKKWGLFGRRFTKRRQPLCLLSELSRRDRGGSILENLILDGLIFQRQHDVEAVLGEEDGAKPVDRIAESLCLLRPHDTNRDFLAVDWRGGGWQLLEILRRDSGTGGYGGHKIVRRGSGGESRSKKKNLVFGEIAGRFYRIAVETREPGSPQKIRLHTLNLPGSPESQTEFCLPDGISLDPEIEKVSLMQEVAPGIVLVAFEPRDGKTRLRWLSVVIDGQRPWRLELSEKSELPTARAEDDPAVSNPVTALARAESPRCGVMALVGCRDGRVWKVGRQDRWVEVGRLGAPITALADRMSDDGVERIFAGTGDGTIVTWETIAGQYTTLWATRPAQDAVVSIQALNSRMTLPPEEGEEELTQEFVPCVVALTRQGRILLFDDRNQVSRPGPGDRSRHHRLNFPGARLGSILLGASSFSFLVLSDCRDERVPGMLCRLAVATATGARLISLYYPERAPGRKRKFQCILKTWQDYIQPTSKDVGEARSDPFPPPVHGFTRHTETGYAADRLLPRMLIGWLFRSQGKQSIFTQLPPPRQQWFPRIDRPLVTMALKWNEEDAGLAGLFEEALKRAEEADDYELYKEILRFVLRESNIRFFDENDSGRLEEFSQQYLKMLDTIEKVCDDCVGKPTDVDVDVHCTLARELPDGDVLWRLFIRDGDDPPEHIQKILGRRLNLVERWLNHDSLDVGLEALHASNLAILRACQRLDRRDEEWPGPQRDPAHGELPFNVIRRYHETVKAFTGRVLQTAQGDVVAHELARAFTLCMFACPSAIAPLTAWIYEINFQEDFLKRVRKEVDLLKNHLAPLRLPDRAYEIFERLTQYVVDETQIRNFFQNDSDDDLEPVTVGWRNAEFFRDARPFGEVIKWLDELSSNLAGNPGTITFERWISIVSRMAKARKEVDRSAGDRLYVFTHSLEFWKGAVDDLDDQMKNFPDLPRGAERDFGFGEEPAPVRPEVVLFSKTLADWCVRQIAKLNELRGEHRIFNPHYRIYHDVLGKLQEAAARFRDSASVQKRIVLSVLDHGLLAHLDLHLLEIWEAAQVLDPLESWEREKEEISVSKTLSNGTSEATAARFSTHLLDLSRKAESIPKNLRNLRGLLGFESVGDAPVDLVKFLYRFAELYEWENDLPLESDVSLDDRERYFLHLCMVELAQNHRDYKYGGGKPVVSMIAKLPVKVAHDGFENHSTVQVKFRLDIDDTEIVELYRKRLLELEDNTRLQEMFPAWEWEGAAVPSQGAGLYLACLAAASAGWRLRLKEPGIDGLTFWLTRVDQRGET